MPETTRKYDSTVARIAGNLLSGDWPPHLSVGGEPAVVEWAVRLARAIVAEVKRTEPAPGGDPQP